MSNKKLGPKIIKKLKDWRNRKANLEGIERYVILHNKTIDEIADKLPRSEKVPFKHCQSS